MRLLMLTDFSEAADRALRYGCRLLEATGGEGLVLHVYHIPVVDAEMPLTIYEEVVEKTKAEVAQQLNTVVERLRKECPLVSLQAVHRMGQVVEEALSVADKWAPDYLVVGSRGASSVWEMLFGSTTVDLLSASPWPVWVVPLHATAEPPRRMAYAAPLIDEQFFPVADFFLTARRLSAEITYLHIPSERSSNNPLQQRHKRVLLDFLRQWHPSTRYHELPHQPQRQLNEQFARFVKEKNIHAVGIHQRHKGLFDLLFGKSLTYQMLHHTHIPLIVYP